MAIFLSAPIILKLDILTQNTLLSVSQKVSEKNIDLVMSYGASKSSKKLGLETGL